METSPPPEESDKNRLEKMPEVVMERILKDCDYCDINSLRKTCTETRRLVDLVKPDLGVYHLECLWGVDLISMELLYGCSMRKEVVYRNHNGGCSVSKSCDLRGRFFESTTAAEMFSRDFKILLPMLMRQKSPIHDCTLILKNNGFPVFQATMARLLNDFSTKLRIKGLKLSSSEHPELHSILPLVCADTITWLTITTGTSRSEALDLSRVVQLDQWKNIRGFSLCGYLPDSLPRLLQFSTCSLDLETISPDVVISLREMFRNSPIFEGCLIFVHNMENFDEIKRTLSRTDTAPNYLHFSTNTPEYVLTIGISTSICFRKDLLSEWANEIILH